MDLGQVQHKHFHSSEDKPASHQGPKANISLLEIALLPSESKKEKKKRERGAGGRKKKEKKRKTHLLSSVQESCSGLSTVTQHPAQVQAQCSQS